VVHHRAGSRRRFAEVDVVGELPHVRGRRRSRRHLTRVRELVHVARAAIGAGQQNRDAGLRDRRQGNGLPVSPKRLRRASRNRSFCNAIAISEICPVTAGREKEWSCCGGIRSDPGAAGACKGSIADPFPVARAGPLRSGTPREDQRDPEADRQRGIKYIFFQPGLRLGPP